MNITKIFKFELLSRNKENNILTTMKSNTVRNTIKYNCQVPTKVLLNKYDDSRNN